MDEGGVSLRNGLGNVAGAILGGAGLVAFAGGAAALEVTQPLPWQINLQPAASPIIIPKSNPIVRIILLDRNWPSHKSWDTN